MGYTALLFCPDEKTSRVLSQILGELEFGVESVSEPFAAVKKITAQRYDAIVVDCENEQNGALVFKSARSSGSNQAALSVAVVEGQTGVAKAFRLGANLVLTKPINIEQSKGTLRVARGLLRKGENARPVEPAAPVATTSVRPSSAPPLTSSGAAFDLDPEPDQAPGPAEAALLEYMPPTTSSASSAAASAEQFPWQPASKLGEPMASALRRAAERAGKSDPLPAPPAQKTSSFGAAAAPAPAREIASVQPIKTAEAILDEPEDFGVLEPVAARSSAPAASVPTFSSFSEGESARESSGSGKKFVFILLAAALLVGAYFGWKSFASHPQTAAQPAAQAVTETAAPLTSSAATENAASDAPSEIELQKTDAEPAAAGSRNAAKPSAAKTSTIAPDTVIKNPEAHATSQPLVVNESAAKAAKAQEVQDAPSLALTAQADDKALAGIIANTSAAMPKQPAQSLRVSQGVSQGLLVKRVTPVYPQQARQMRLEGAVQLLATIGKSGDVTGVKQLSGEGILARAASDAVRQWKYKPYYLNGEPIEIQTQITVNFKLP